MGHLTERTERFCFAFTIKSQQKETAKNAKTKNKSLKWCIQIMGRKVKTQQRKKGKKKFAEGTENTVTDIFRSLSCRFYFCALWRVVFKCWRWNGKKCAVVCVFGVSLKIEGWALKNAGKFGLNFGTIQQLSKMNRENQNSLFWRHEFQWKLIKWCFEIIWTIQMLQRILFKTIQMPFKNLFETIHMLLCNYLLTVQMIFMKMLETTDIFFAKSS